jgi:ABC-type glycerol-3-phosphate transport system permease component
MVIGNNVYTAIGLFTTCGLMILGLLATYPAVKAYAKGRRFVTWYIFGVLLLPVAVIASLCIKGSDRT